VAVHVVPLSTEATEVIVVQSTGKFTMRRRNLPVRHTNFVWDIETHVTNLVGRIRTPATARNPTAKQPLASVDDIAAVVAWASGEDAIFIAQDEIACLDDMSLEGDIPDDVSDS
jgi:hypothetical protein